MSFFSDGFWTMVGVVLPVLIVQVFQYLAVKKNAAKSEADRQEIKAQVCEVKDRIETVSMTKQDIDRQIAGAERQNIVAGIEIGKQQASGSMPLGK